ncbi:uncharacterized protein LOC111707106 [Eurytemora carolleeae]|uniref:uncharacterized protein LOC111707106 n=1 Tax=Eurytemora carolleeae TaxID=1294199 RepID=UPI000C78FC4F|nr:uncharacterized protein LOC111707106 [Eurytemora carolleeae]|eukprot:XP_023335873.1 uncharacterized protein LOC111707106 [Eurytemora affinis]
MILMYALKIIFIFKSVFSVPIVEEREDSYVPELPSDFCSLPAELDYKGASRYIQDCESLGRLEIPIPAPSTEQRGIHPVVCCPRNIDTKVSICFPTDAWCPTYTQPVYDDYDNAAESVAADDLTVGGEDVSQYDDGIDQRQYDDGANNEYNTDYEYIAEVEVLLSNVEINCLGVVNTTCTPFSRCNIMEELDLNPQTLEQTTRFCSFDEASAELMICCPFKNILQTSKLPENPRFPVNNKPRKCEDQTNLCQRWSKKGACALDKSFVTSEVDPYQNVVTNLDMFQFTMKGCMESCNRCGSKGCVDEFPLCPQWAREGYCTAYSFFMAHSCRESCGSCGFLSTLSTEKQVYQGKSYSRISDPNFDCGRYKDLDFLESIGLEVIKNSDETSEEAKAEDADTDANFCEVSNNEDDTALGNANSNTTVFCSASIIADKWMITAAHCSDEINPTLDGERRIKSQILRTTIPSLKELVEVKNIYLHPRYRYGELHADIALIELGRRVEFKPEEFGDTPICLDKGLDLPDKVATAQGFGKTEKDDKGGKLLEINVTLVNTNECINQINTFLQAPRVRRKKQIFCKTMPMGISDEQICANGIKKDDGITTAACKGDSGGPLFLQDEEGRRNLVGIVSGSLSCCGNAPEWYTSIQYNRKWIECILDRAPTLNFNKAKVEAECKGAGIRKGKDDFSICGQ